MSDKEIDRVIENEREWRKHLLSEIQEMRKEHRTFRDDFVLFKGKALGFISVLVGVAELLKYKLFGK